MSPRREPPRMARRLLERALPADAREHVVADMDELFEQRLERDGAWRARSWFFLQAITFWVRFWFVRRTSTRVAFSLLDWKLGARMLLKHPGISLVGGLALATVIAVGAGFFHMARIHFDPDLKLAEHERIVRLDRFDVGGQDQWPVTMPEVLAWRGALTEVVELSAYRTVERNLIATLGESETAVDVPVVVAEITPSAFLLTRLPPARGRGLTEADAHPDALPVVVLEWGLWQKRLGADPGIVGQEVRLGRETYTVVGVMPEGFVFPRYHEAWIPLPAERDVPGWVQAFGRLAPGATLESAQAELSAVATRTFADVASDDERYTGVPADLMQARVIGYADPDPASGDALGIIMASFMVLLALVAVAANVATLVFARTAMRESEIVVRTALGASRARVVAQLFVESLVLALVAAGVGLVGLNVVLEVLARPDTERLPYWTRAPLDLPTLLFSVGFAALGAGLVALLPALKSTGAGVQERLRSMGAGGTSLRFGGVWSVIIVMQVAITVACLPFGVDAAHGTLVELGQQSQFHAESYLSFRLEVDPDASGVGPDAAQNDRYRMQMANSYTQLERSLSAEATVADVTFGDALPGMGRPWALYEPNQAAADSAAGRNWSAQYSSVATDYFEVFGAPIVAGRGFNEGDIGAANRPVIVNEAFARTLGGNVIGSLLRLAAPEGAEPGDWYEIVGVVGELGTDPMQDGQWARGVYHPVTAADVFPLEVGIKTRGDPAAVATRLRALAGEIDPGIRLYNVRGLDELIRDNNQSGIVFSLMMVGIILICMLLSAAGLFALMAVGVARRSREIGIRLALGASRKSVLNALFGRAAKQIGAGIVLGSLMIVALNTIIEDLTGTLLIPIASVAVAMALVGLIACAVPARRALRLQPTEALREG